MELRGSQVACLDFQTGKGPPRIAWASIQEMVKSAEVVVHVKYIIKLQHDSVRTSYPVPCNFNLLLISAVAPILKDPILRMLTVFT